MTTEHCRHCGAAFKASPTGRTVHCPEHRSAEARRTVKLTTRECYSCLGGERACFNPSCVGGRVAIEKVGR